MDNLMIIVSGIIFTIGGFYLGVYFAKVYERRKILRLKSVAKIGDFSVVTYPPFGDSGTLVPLDGVRVIASQLSGLSGLSTRAANALRAHGLNCMEDISELSLGELLKLDGIGRKTAEEIAAAIGRLNITERRPGDG